MSIRPLALCAALAACSGDPTPTDPNGCAADAECIAVPDWNGPVAVRTAASADPAPTCSGEVAFDRTTGLDAAPAECSCACGGPTEPVACPETATLESFADNVVNCVLQDVVSTVEITEGCTDIPFYDDVSLRLRIDPPDLSGVTCEAQPTVEIPAATWATRVVGCELAEPPSQCAGGSCLPTALPDEAALCVWTEGDAECPAGPFDQRTVVYDGVDDGRTCTACTCGDATGECTGVATLKSGESCSAGSPGAAPQDECMPIETPARSVDFAYDPLTVTCAPSAVSPTGAATGAGAITVCCMP